MLSCSTLISFPLCLKQMAATALRHGLPLVTHNPADFEMIEELELITTVK